MACGRVIAEDIPLFCDETEKVIGIFIVYFVCNVIKRLEKNIYFFIKYRHPFM